MLDTPYWAGPIRFIFMDTAYGRRSIRRIGNCEYAFSCEDLALIRRTFFLGYDVSVRMCPKRPYDEDGNTSNEDGNSGVTFDDCNITVEDEVTGVATQIEDNVTSEGNVQINQNCEGSSNSLKTSPILRRSTRKKVMPAKFNDFVVNSNSTEPKTFHEASQNPKWVEAMNLEMEALYRNNTYVLANLPPGRKAMRFYVDDIVIIGNNKNEIDKFKRFLSSKFMIKDPGFEYGLLACKPAATPLQQNVMLSYEESESDKFLSNMTEYQKIVGKLIYLSITRPDISYCSVLKKQATISRSSAESDYRCLASTTCEIIWVIKVSKDLGVDGLLPVHLYCDSSSAISIVGNPVFHEKIKHFEIDLHLVREKVSDGVVKVLKVASASNVADIFNKSLGIAKHNEFCKKLSLVNMFKP
ncbi:ribonuclease H-like domain-containing protein [Tanacetum coccineum]|uniref:Ribonuclease H-like domain-containing protein n=1 Tax=Tanacetum coccineum TaxID=301880 RepID=A0ABQ4YJL5_9ASTR